MNKINEITSGKAKSLYTTDNENHLIMNFRDDTSAFDGKKKEALLGKGAVNNQFNAFILEHLENNNVFPSQIIKETFLFIQACLYLSPLSPFVSP